MSTARRHARNRYRRQLARYWRDRVPPDYCHAGAGHDHPTDRGAPGKLCDRCFAAYLRILHRGAVSLMSGAPVTLEKKAAA